MSHPTVNKIVKRVNDSYKPSDEDEDIDEQTSTAVSNFVDDDEILETYGSVKRFVAIPMDNNFRIDPVRGDGRCGFNAVHTAAISASLTTMDFRAFYSHLATQCNNGIVDTMDTLNKRQRTLVFNRNERLQKTVAKIDMMLASTTSGQFLQQQYWMDTDDLGVVSSVFVFHIVVITETAGDYQFKPLGGFEYIGNEETQGRCIYLEHLPEHFNIVTPCSPISVVFQFAVECVKYIPAGFETYLYVSRCSIRPGCFTSRSHEKGCNVGVYSGEISNERIYAAYRQFVLKVGKCYISTMHAGNETRFINHSDNANCILTIDPDSTQLRVLVVSLKPICAKEEITVNYDEHMSKSKMISSMKNSKKATSSSSATSACPQPRENGKESGKRYVYIAVFHDN